MSVTIYLEGGGNQNATKTRCRQGFKKFIENMLPGKQMPSLVACGSRNDAYDSFVTALESLEDGDLVFLLVDSESEVSPGVMPWTHFGQRTGDEKMVRPEDATDTHAHMMVQCVESWFVADPDKVKEYYGADKFAAGKLPVLRSGSVEPIPKDQVQRALHEAAKDTKKKGYEKGRDGFELLKSIRPEMVINASQHARRFRDVLASVLDDMPSKNTSNSP